MQKKSKILIVDDEAGILNALSFILSKEGYEVETALNGNEGFDKIMSSSFDGVVSDWKMPGMDGISLLKKVRSENIFIPFVFLSGHADINEEQEMVNYGAYRLIHKPDFESVPRTLKSMLIIDNKIEDRSEKATMEVEFLKIMNNADKKSF